ncbi:glycoside hydrolase family 15 protein [uncultured Phycicoccus sp.]|uniref:glycoside hydrolase family 15 protein n=1 Tax=uncultured Phycicoccus sp. TaxID=661422 RepID=UPI002639E231|nr:glycoside hydrolase family 15 protein [uncultured Phycicoccus sp.]
MTTLPSHRTHDLVALARRSHAVIREHQHASGAYPASPTFSAYRGYAWLRDGGFTAEGMSRYGDLASVNAFHDWVDATLSARRDQVDELVALRAAGREVPRDLLLPTRFTLDGGDGTDEWWDFQTDGYGTWLWSVVTHARRHGLDPGRWRRGIEVAVDFVGAFWDRPCFDWWEEHDEQRHVSTLGAIVGGLEAVAGAGVPDAARASTCRDVAARARALALAEGVADGHLTKWLGSTAVDGSLPACVVPFGLVEVGSPLARGTVAAVARDLDADGGVHRFLADVFYGGGQWLLLSCLLGWNLAAQGDTEGARRLLDWVAAQAADSGEMPEQVGHHLLHPHTRAEWVERWGEVATPLLWSHGMYLVLADELGLLEGVQA